MPDPAVRTVRPALLAAWALLAAAGLPAQEAPQGRPLRPPPGPPDQAIAPYDFDAADRPVAEIRITGLKRVEPQYVANQLRTVVGAPFDPQTIKDDIARLYGLAEFRHISAQLELLPDGSVAVIYVLEEAPVIAEVQVVGNKVIPDQDILAVSRLSPGLRRDDYVIENAKLQIQELYRQRGYYLTTVSVDESELEETGILLFRVIEGPRVKIRAIEFEGNLAFDDDRLQAEIETRTAFPVLRKGELDQERLIEDVAALARFYSDRGYIDVRVDRTLELSPDSSEAKVTFHVVEGPQYTLRSVEIDPDRPLRVFTREQITALMTIKPGDVYSADRIRDSVRAIRDTYLLMSYVDLLNEQRIRVTPIRAGGERAEVTLLLGIDEGEPSKVGLVHVTGNFLTRDKVIRRHLSGITPGSPFDGRAVGRAEDALRATRLFNQVEISVRDPDPASPEYRDVIVEVKEANTGSVNFGVAAGSDTGVFGEFSVVQRNFDITDLPTSWGELVKGRALRGAGQRFAMTLRPGNELFNYLMSWTEPYLFDTTNLLRVAGSYTDREYNSGGDDLYDERRLSFPITLGRKLGQLWDVGVTARFERIELDDIELTAPVDYFEAAGPDNLTSIALNLIRSTVTEFTRPGEGTRLELTLEQAGALGGDITFSRVVADYTVFLTTYRDFLGRRQILRLNGRLGYIFAGDAPVYERFYLGGRSLRGFEFRTVSPKGVTLAGAPTTDPVGGDWMLFAGAQYEVPLVEENLNVVFFVDSGTVTNDPGIDEYRVAFGAGLRIYIPQFGPVPLAFDFAVPVLEEDGDESQVFSFSAELPF